MCTYYYYYLKCISIIYFRFSSTAHQPNVIRTIRAVNGNFCYHSKRADRKCLTFDRKKFKMHWNHCNCCWCNRFRCRESKLYGREKVIFLFKMRWKKYSEIELLNIYTSSKVFMCLARTCSFSLTFSLSPLYLALSNFSLFFSPFPLSLYFDLSLFPFSHSWQMFAIIKPYTSTYKQECNSSN